MTKFPVIKVLVGRTLLIVSKKKNLFVDFNVMETNSKKLQAFKKTVSGYIACLSYSMHLLPIEIFLALHTWHTWKRVNFHGSNLNRITITGNRIAGDNITKTFSDYTKHEASPNMGVY